MEKVPDHPADADLKRLIEIVVRDFNGDTSAYFASLKSTMPDDDYPAKVGRRTVCGYTESL